MRAGRFALVGAMVMALAGAPTAAQFSAAPSDLTSLERRADEARARINASGPVSGANPGEVSRLQEELDAISDELAYLRVKSRRGERVTDQDRRDVADRLSRLEAQIAGRASDTGDRSQIPVGTELDIRLQTPLSSDDAQVEQRVDATTVVPLYRGEGVAVPAGSSVVGHVVAVDRASRTDRRGSLVLQFTRLTVGGREHDVTLSITEALESEGIRGEIGRIGAGAGVGAILGGILGGVKGALAGILIGGGGTVLATEGKDVKLPAGTILRVRFDAPLDLETR